MPDLLTKLAAPAFALGLLSSCAAVSETLQAEEPAVEDVAAAPSPIVTEPWREAVVSVTEIDRTARFFLEIGGYEEIWRGALGADEIEVLGLPETASGEAMVMRAPGSDSGYIRLVRFDNAGRKVPTRPGARAWDTGCFWSIMVRAKDLEAVYDDAVAMGWWTETPIAPLSFNGSELRIVVFKGPDGVQVQTYERLNRPIPEGFTDFERLSRPFNIMQMTHDRDEARRLMVDVLGFETFWFGPPHTDEEPTLMPLGIPQNLTTSVPYLAGIFSPAGQTLYGRMEYIEIDGLDGFNYADRCIAPNLGTLAVVYPVDNADDAMAAVKERGWAIERGPYIVDRKPYGLVRAFTIKSPDGATIEFIQNIDD